MSYKFWNNIEEKFETISDSLEYIPISGDYTAGANERLNIDTSGGSITLTVSNTLQDGESILLSDLKGSFATNPLFVVEQDGIDINYQGNLDNILEVDISNVDLKIMKSNGRLEVL